MNLQNAVSRIEELKSQINYHNKRYYEQDEPEISDFQYDMLYRELESLEDAFPELKSSDSPTNNVGGRPKQSMRSITHDVKMESLHDSFSEEEMNSFINKIKLSIDNPQFVVEPKIDGLSVSIEYKNGLLIRASTRGDGQVGEDITNNIKAIKSVPHQLKQNIPFLEVRGEVYMSQTNFLKLIEQQENNEGKIFKNPRNAAAGSLRQKNPKITGERNLDIFIFNIQKIEGYKLNSHTESLELLQNLGLNVIPFHNVYSSSNDIINEILRIGNLRGKLDFPLDGAVVKVNSFNQRKLLGSTSKFPKWAEAFKYPPEEKETTLLNIEINVGRTGVLTPTGIFSPIELAGTTVSRATLHNQDFINEKDIGIGDTVILRKAGEIIPEVVKVTKKSICHKTYTIPNICPSCGSPTIHEEGISAIRCENTQCPAQLIRHLIHFVSRDAMDIDGLGQKQIEQLVALNLIDSPADIYDLKSEKLLSIDRMGEKSVDNLINAIDASKHMDLYRLIYALGINHVGLAGAKLLTGRFSTIDDIINASVENIADIEGFGSVVASTIVSYFKLPQTLKLIDRLKQLGLNMKAFQSAVVDDRFNNLTFVLTGTLQNYKRNDAKTIIENFGGKVSSSVSKNTDYVLAGTDAGSKLDKAKKLEVKILSESEFEQMIK